MLSNTSYFLCIKSTVPKVVAKKGRSLYVKFLPTMTLATHMTTMFVVNALTVKAAKQRMASNAMARRCPKLSGKEAVKNSP